jgi:GAF domain-containing protein
MTENEQLNQFLKGLNGETFRERCQSICDALRIWAPRYEWVGLYWLDGDYLNLREWSGEQATEHVRIPISQGICGAAIREAKTVIVDDVQLDNRYLACFVNTRSEIVVPIRNMDGKIIGEIDIDGKQAGAFNYEDREFLEGLANYIGEQWPGKP